MHSRIALRLTVVSMVFLLSLSGTYAQESNESVAALLNRAYETLARNPHEALPLFEEAVKRDPSNLLAHKQLGTIYLSVSRKEDALQEFLAAQNISASDTTALQIAYLYDDLGRKEDAYNQFKLLRLSNDPDIREKARVATAVFSSFLCSQGFPWWGKVYSASYYESRFENTILSGALFAGRYLTNDRKVSAFGTVSITRDTRSTGGTLPAIFSDNVMLFGVGLRAQPFTGMIFDAQVGGGYDLIERPGIDRFQEDFRTVLSYGNGWFPELQFPERLRFPFKPFADGYFSAGYYSRYKNSIVYLQARAGFRVAAYYYTALDIYIRGDLVGDTQREYYNNIAEGSAGIRFIPYHPIGVSVLAEFHRGVYWDANSNFAPANRTYNTFRLFLIIDQPLCF